MNSLVALFISLLITVYCEAYPHISLESQDDPLRIVNGTEAEDGEFPYMVQLYNGGFYLCGGAIIAEKWILTSAQCVENYVGSIVYGTNVLAQKSPANTTSTTIKVKRRYHHPEFHYNTTNYVKIPLYDVGLLELAEPIPFNDKAQPLKLAESNDVPFHVPGILAGWGVNDTLERMPSTLQKIELQLLNDAECSRQINSKARFDAFNGIHDLCSDNNHYRGQCNGDSGSPFVIDGLAYGIVSWSFKPCGTSPGAYTRITNPEYRNFIREITGI